MSMSSESDFGSLNFELNSSVLKNIESSLNKVLTNAIMQLAKHYGFNGDEGMRLIGIVPLSQKKGSSSSSGKKKVEKPSIPLPWTGMIKKEWCYGIRPNHELFSQCTNKPEKEGGLCKTCEKQCAKNDGKLLHGQVTDRNRKDYKSKSGKGKTPVTYATVMRKLDICRDEAEAEASKFGLVIPEKEFEEKRRKGASKKSKTQVVEELSSDSDDETVVPAVEAPKKRGRPRKEKKEVKVTNGEELLAALESQKESLLEAPEATEDDLEDVSSNYSPSSSDDEEINVVEVKIGGKMYYMQENEYEEVGCEVLDEAGEFVGTFGKTASGKGKILKS